MFAPMHEVLRHALAAAGQGGLPALGALAVATLISEDLACIAAGLLVARGVVDFGPATLACAGGIFAGDLLLVGLGRTLGRRGLDHPWLRRWMAVDSVPRAERWFARQGPGLILASRFMPGMRLPTYVAAGILRAPWGPFIGWFLLASAVWTPLLVGLAFVLGDMALRVFERWTHVVPGLLLAGLLGWAGVRLAVAASTWRGRRRLIGRWRRLTRWEFWPTWAVYPPVVAYIFWLGVKYRSLTLPTVVNPGIGHGSGLVGESKSEILRGLAGAGEAIATWQLVPPGEAESRMGAVEAFMRRAGLGFPVVLKPDVGERGRGVVIARDPAAVAATLRSHPGAMIAQRYVAGVEFGVFYFRYPSRPHGEILAITEKQTVAVAGDGRRSLEELILADERAVCMAAFFLGRWADRLDGIPAAGERVELSELGTHCRGALFLDGTHRVTPALRTAVERVSRSFPGFHFGRYDVRTESAAALERGEFTVIELNGLTSEATSIYDPRHSVWQGWRTLCRQWRIAFEIAAELRARGERPCGARATWRLLHRPEISS